MKALTVGAIMVAAILSSGCATLVRGVLENRGVGAGTGEATTFQRGPVYGVGAEAQPHSLADGFGRRPSPASPVGMATPIPVLEPGDSPLAEQGVVGLGVKGIPAANIRKLGVSGYAKSWAESGLGRSVEDISHDPSLIYVYIQVRVFPGGESHMVLY